MRNTLNALVGVGAMLALSGCASLPPSCLPPQQSMLSAELSFGRTIGDRTGVSDAEFARFIADEITPRFPEGLTVLDGHGQWRDPARCRLLREPSKLVWIVFADDPAKRAALTEIAEAYKRKFGQQSVLVAVRPSCVSF
jgi:hypothetical protein